MEITPEMAATIDEVLAGFDFAHVASLFKALGYTYGGPGAPEALTTYEPHAFGRMPLHVPTEAELREAGRELLADAVRRGPGATVDSGHLYALYTGHRLALLFVPVESEVGL